MSQTHVSTRLKEAPTSVTFPRMASRRLPRPTSRDRRRRAAERARRFAALTVVGAVLVVTLVLTAFDPGSAPRATEAGPAPPTRLAATGRPRPQIIAMNGLLRILLPVSQGQLTAIGYHGAGDGALALEPQGRQGNRSLLGRVVDRLFRGDSRGLVYYRLGGGRGPETSAIDVGAAPGTDVFSPLDGTVIGISDFVLNRRTYGVRVDIQPAAAPSLVVSVTRLRPDPALTVGSTVAATTSRLGSVLALSHVERQALARYTQDAGNHVTIEVRPAATLGLR
jgi:hypothetical protein